MLAEFGPSLYVADGPTVSFFGFPYPTRMAVAHLSDGNVWVWSPIALTDQLARAIDDIGPVRHIVSPNKLHHLFLRVWAERWPDARLYAPPGLARKMPELRFDALLQGKPEAAWANDIDQVIFRGSFAMAEVVFFHKASRTAIFGDLIQRFPPENMSGFMGLLMRTRWTCWRPRQHTARMACQLSQPRACARCTAKGPELEARSATDSTRQLHQDGRSGGYQ